MNLWHRIKAAFQPRPGEARVYVGQNQAGVRVTEDTALTYAAVWACVRVISETMAALPWHVYRRTESGREAVDSQVAWLLNNQPNMEMTAFSFREALMAHVLTWGNGYAEIVKDMAGRVMELWLLSPDRVCVERDRDTKALVYRITNPDGPDTFLAADRVLHIHGLGFDGVSGYSPVRMAARSIGLGLAQDTFAQAFYANGTVFGAIVEMPAGRMDAKQIDDAEKLLNDKSRGPDKAFKVKVVPNGSAVHKLSMPLTDAQFLESRKFSVTDIARWFRVPPHKIADLDRSTNNNIEHQSIEFVTDTIVPWARRLEQEANVKLFAARSQGRQYTSLSINALMRGDSKARAEFYRTMLQIGAMSINEIRSLEELNGIGDAGDAHLVQINQTTLEWLVDNPGTKANQPASEPVAEPEATEAEPPVKPTNVIRAQALEWLREQRKHA